MFGPASHEAGYRARSAAIGRSPASHDAGYISRSSSGAVFAAAEVDLADFGVGLYVVEFSFA